MKIALKDIAIIFAVSFVLLLPVLVNGIPDNYDLVQHVRFAVAYDDSLHAGMPQAEWSSRDNFGFGGVGVRVYPPLTYFLLAACHALLADWHLAFWLVMLFGMFAGCVGVYLFSRDEFGQGSPLTAAILYAVVPYHLFQIYQVFLLAEFIAAAIFPFAFLFAARLVRQQSIVNIVSFAAAFSLLMLTHIPTTIIVAASLAIFIGLQLNRENFIRVACSGVLSALIAIAATLFYLLKVVTEVGWVKHNSEEFFRGGLYNYAAYFFPMFLWPAEFYQQRFLWLWDIMIFLLVLFFVPAAIRTWRSNLFDVAVRRAVVVVGAVSLVMLSWLSAPLWQMLPFLQKLQFPWRWLSVATFAAAVCGGAAVPMLREKFTGRRIAVYAAVLLMAAMLLFDLTQTIIPAGSLSKQEFQKQVVESENDIACVCWWPIWAAPDALNDKTKASADGREVAIDEWEPLERRLSVAAGNAGELRIATFFYPYWKAEVNGHAVPGAMEAGGALIVSVPAEASVVRVFFQEPFFLRAAKFVSLAAWAALIVTLGVIALRSRSTGGETLP